jgi:hypothetical protein
MIVITLVRLGYKPTNITSGAQIVAISECSQGFFLCFFFCMVMTYFDLLGCTTKMGQSIELGIEFTKKVINGVWCQIR